VFASELSSGASIQVSYMQLAILDHLENTAN